MEKNTAKDFTIKVLNGVAIGIVIGLIPHAILGEVFKALSPYGSIFVTLYRVLYAIQFTVPILVGLCVAQQFKFSIPEAASLAFITFIAAGSVVFVDGSWVIRGIGDLINTMLAVTIGVLVIQWYRGKLVSLTIILLPLVASAVAALSVFTLPYIRMISSAIGNLIHTFTTLHPLPMSILLSISFSIIIISPVSTVAIAFAVGLTGLASGAANLGVVACATTLVVGSLYVNKIGISLAVFFGSMKIFMPNWLRYPILNVPIVLNGIVCGVLAWLFNIQGTAASAGFGFSGLVGPINAYKFMTQSPMLRIGILFLVYFVLSFLGAVIIDFLLVKVFKLYKRDIFIFDDNK